MIKYFSLKQGVSYLVFIFLLLIAVFTRSFIGLTIYGFRLGELIIGGCLFLSLTLIFSPNINKKINFTERQFIPTFRIIVIYLLFNFFINYENFNLYYLKASSYIWTVGIIFLGALISYLYQDSKIITFGFFISPIFVYIIQTGNYPNFVIDIFIKYSDKFEFMKSADMVAIVIISSLFVKSVGISEYFNYLYFNFLVFLFLPITLTTSRGAVLGLLVFWVIESISYINFIKNKKTALLVMILINVIIFTFSILRVSDIDFRNQDEAPITVVTGAIDSISKQKNTQDVFLTFYFSDGRVMSTDPTTNWRLDIWQDVIEDLISKNKLLTGYGYQEIIPVMTDPSAPGRLGRDGLNEHVHNYFFTIIARGGLINLALFIFLHFLILKKLIINIGISAYSLIVPSLLIASLDIVMDGVQFPILYYFFIGYFSQKKY